MESLVTLVKSLDPASQAAVAFLAVLGFLALKLFPRATPIRIRLVVFFTLVGFAGGGLAFSRHNARVDAENADPHEKGGTPRPAQTIGSAPRHSSLTAVAYADDGGGWIFVGKYDNGQARWVEGPMVALRAATAPPQAGDEVRTTAATALYDDRPRFNVFSQTWKLGARQSEVGPDRRLSVVEPPVFVGPNVWCRVRPR